MNGSPLLLPTLGHFSVPDTGPKSNPTITFLRQGFPFLPDSGPCLRHYEWRPSDWGAQAEGSGGGLCL
jgi:hypothetical protein